MENLLRDGDYVPNGFGGFVRLQDTDALLQRALFRLTVRRGSFPFLPRLGSRLMELGRERRDARSTVARQYAAEALEGMGLLVEEARIREVSAEQLGIAFDLRLSGQTKQVEVTV